MEKFRQATTKWNQNVGAQSGADSENGNDDNKSHMIVVTDTCLPLLASGESSISARVLINYELPTKKVPFSLHSCEVIFQAGLNFWAEFFLLLY